MINEEQYRQWVAILESQLQDAVRIGRSLDEARALVGGNIPKDFGHDLIALETRNRAFAEATETYRGRLERVSYLRRTAIRSGREDWYAGATGDAENWNGLCSLLSSKGRSDEEISDLDRESTSVLSLLDNPGKERFATRGLVVGHVQSGKTGNMAAVLAKAADTHFKFFLVLSGMTDALRNQTQKRLDSDLVGTAPERWYSWTAPDSEERNGDFAHPPAQGFEFSHKNQLAVVKKNGKVLRRFLAKVRATDNATLRNTPFLLIDDECDQASVNSAALDKAVTRINGYIRDILRQFPRAAYVGYTATPFANVLIDTEVEDDLYPRSFIHALEAPDAYFGAERLFGRAALDGEYEDQDAGYDMIRPVPEEELPMLRPKSGAKSTFRFEISPSLADAIRYFVMVNATRQLRGQGNFHSTMLVHTSVLNTIHRSTAKAITPFLAELIAALRSNDPAVLRDMRDQWEREQDTVLAEEFDLSPVSFDAIAPHLAATAESIEIKVENWSSDNRIDYSVPGRRCLVIGGNVLARGLTLEGLSVSYFLRSSSQYDTLMQMGRWFGYREGFGDLPRVWMEDDVKQHFIDLATVDAEIRRDIARYGEENITPKEFAVRIRSIPGMAITARAKMRHAQTVQIGYAGSHEQTTRFRHKDLGWLSDNWNAGSKLLDHGTSATVRETPVKLGVPAAAVLEFLGRYKSHESHRQMDPRLLRQHIENFVRGPWNVAVVAGPDRAQLSQASLGSIGLVPTVTRSALAELGTQSDAYIKALMSKADVVADLEGVPPGKLDWNAYKQVREERNAPPLLLLYPISKVSDPRAPAAGKKSERTRLDAVHDVLGLAIVFPGPQTQRIEYVAANLAPDEAEVPEGEDELPATLTDSDQVPSP